MNEGDLILREEDYFELLSFFVSSALLLSQSEQEEELYPSLRLMDAARRLTQALIENGGFEEEAWAHEFVAACENSLDLVMRDEDAFLDFIQRMTTELAVEMKSRARAGS
jgi:hypothetical protein